MAPWPTVARREKALPELDSRHKREHHVPESEAGLRAHDCRPRWRRSANLAVGAMARRGERVSSRRERGEARRVCKWRSGFSRAVGVARMQVSYQQIQLSPVVTYSSDRHYDHQYYGNLDTILNLDEFKCQEAHSERAQHKNGRGGVSKPYVRHLSPKKNPKPGSGGQRAIKAAMSTVAGMHMVRLAQWRQCCYQMEMAVAAPTSGSNNSNQQQHVLSERKRREKLNDSFKALRTVLPLHPRARHYVTTLESRVSELEEKNMMLVELLHHRNNGGDQGDVSGKKIEVDIDINREACEVKETSQEFCLKIMVGSECNAMDDVVSILERLK
ncbi:unnamed protein product [Miscanthus lutarioriparius]|uniref:BHLH domain-containing protein n=1 Tax=Miscanthus lutarioriparius TaxID=422564 RepID=A0A811SPF8_9POAL|nr:unnamed protein product [Miscanthus lutarioriparius]